MILDISDFKFCVIAGLTRNLIIKEMLKQVQQDAILSILSANIRKIILKSSV